MWTTFIIIAATSKACLFCISPALCSSSRLRLCSQVTSLLTCNAQDTKVLDDTRTSASFLLLPERGNLRCWATAFWQLGWERGLGQPGSQAPCLPPSASRDNPQEPGKGGQGLKPQINDISVASNAGTINPIIYRVASGLSFKLPSQTMAGQSPLPGFPERLREHGAKLASGGQHWDSPPVTCHLQGGSLGTLRGPGAQRRKICLLQKLSRAAGGRWPGSRIEVWGARTATSPFVTLATHQILGVSNVGGQTGASVSGGERAVPSPSPTRAVSILDVGEAAVPSSRAAAACLSPWQPGQKTDLPVSRL